MLGLLIQLLEDLHERQKQETAMQEEMENLQNISKSEKQNLAEVVSDRDELRLLCDEKDSALQVSIFWFTIEFL